MSVGLDQLTALFKRPSIAEHCGRFQELLGAAPLQPGDPAVVPFLDKYLEDLLYNVFGEVIPGTHDIAPEASFLELVDDKPSAADERALLELLSPDGKLFQILLALSPPVQDFDAMLRENWKLEFAPARGPSSSPTSANPPESPVAPQQDGDGGYTMPFPLTALVTHEVAYGVLGEQDSADIAELTAGTVPAVLAVPVWRPPLRTRQVRTARYRDSRYALDLSPAAYFLARLLRFLPRVAATEPIPSEWAEPPIRGWFARFEDACTDGFSAAAAKLSFGLFGGSRGNSNGPRFVVYTELLHRYIVALCGEQPQVSSSHARRAARGPNGGVGFTRQPSTMEALGAFLLHGAAATWTCVSPNVTEPERQPLSDPARMSVLAYTLPFLSGFLGVVPEPSTAAPSAVRRGAAAMSRDTVVPRERLQIEQVRDEMAFPATALYRLTLRTLRQVAITMPLAFRVPPAHAAGLVRLFVATARTPSISECSADVYVLRRWELFSVVLRDVAQCALQSGGFLFDHLANCSSAAAPSGNAKDGGLTSAQRTASANAALDVLTGFADIFGIMAQPDVARALQHYSDAVTALPLAGAHGGNVVQERLVLAWAETGHGLPPGAILPVTRGDTAAAVHDLSSQLRIRALDLGDFATLQGVIQTVTEAVSSVFTDVDAARHRKQPPRERPPRDEGAAQASSFRSYTEADFSAAPARRSERLDGKRIDVRRARDVHDLEDVQVRRGGSSSSRAHVGESRALLALTHAIDWGALALRTRWSVAAGSIPVCPRGHVMKLDTLERGVGSWFCEVCGSAVCSGPRPVPMTPHGFELLAEDDTFEHTAEDAVCGECCLFLRRRGGIGAQQRYICEETGEYYCAECASRPFCVYSCRWMATPALVLHFALKVAALIFVLWLVTRWTTAPTATMGAGPRHGGVRGMPTVEEIDDML